MRTGLPWWFSGKESACQRKRCGFDPSPHTGQMVIIKKSTNNKCWRGCGEKGNPLTLLVGMQTSVATVHYRQQCGDSLKS